MLCDSGHDNVLISSRYRHNFIRSGISPSANVPKWAAYAATTSHPLRIHKFIRSGIEVVITGLTRNH